jgi:glycosyltransferase involved in cell wall biosynthesis
VPDLIHSYSFYLNFAAYSAAWSTRTVAIGSVRGEFEELKKDNGRWLGSLSARWPRHQIVNNESAAQSMREVGGRFVPHQISVVRNGLDLNYFRVASLKSSKRPSIVGVGSLIPIKRWDRLISAAQQLKRRGLEFLVRIVGDGVVRKSLEEQAQRLKVEECVELIGQSDDIPAVLAEATVLAHTSNSEGCPNVVMEAMACARPVIATKVGDVPGLVEDGKTGFVVPPGDEALLVDRLSQLLMDFRLCEAMGKAGREKAEREFGLDRLVAQTFAAYQAAGWRGA